MTQDNTMEIATDDALTVGHMHRIVSEIQAKFGPESYVSMSVSTYRWREDDAGTLTMYPDGVCDTKTGKTIRGGSWAEIIQEGMAWADNYVPVRRNALIRRMALAIIEITDEHGKCTDSLLQTKGFIAAEITEHHKAACVRAGEMAGNAPFVVVMDAAS